ncbi:Uncharacterized protein APZ42_016610 [Daphnia magna]|uniref:Uncharacterized protein n=1 Tax=Daphnia magna TaxID=35525 RepID=A0A165AI27_9CRUS|nr:Uncharacterized protein APZ42_016610 [Daphnia magna]
MTWRYGGELPAVSDRNRQQIKPPLYGNFLFLRAQTGELAYTNRCYIHFLFFFFFFLCVCVCVEGSCPFAAHSSTLASLVVSCLSLPPASRPSLAPV